MHFTKKLDLVRDPMRFGVARNVRWVLIYDVILMLI